jgi:eukaryotic-like serine/threonine-protein kinase
MKSFVPRDAWKTESWHGEGDATAASLELPERYELGEELGRGGMAVVYAARDRQLDRRVALKVLQPHRHDAELQRRLVREAQTLAKLRHPAIVTVYDVTHYAGRVFVAMELVEGNTLRAWSAGERSLGTRLAACVAAGRGLAAVHDAGLVHRDFKPDNVLVDRDGGVRVADFGLARLARGDTEAEAPVEATQGTGTLHTLTHVGQLVGTVPYMAPELLRGEPANAASDQFAFAVTLVEVLGGARPFAGETLDAHAQSRTAPPAIPDTIPRWIRAIAVRALAPDAALRFGSMRELLDELGRDPIRRRRQLAIAGGTALAVAAGALAIVLATRSEAPSCEVPARLEAAWSTARAASVRRAFDVAKADPVVRESALATLDAYRRKLGEAYAVACRERANEAPDLAALRVTCLERRTAELAAIAERLEQADERTASRAVAATQNLSGIDECGSIAVLGLRMPRKPAAFEEGRLIDLEIARLKVEVDLGRNVEALAVLEPLLERARKLEHPPTEGEVQILLGATFEALDKLPAAEQAFRRAVLLAQTGRDDALLARAAFQLGLDLVKLQRKEDEGRSWVELAVATIERLPPSPDLESRVLFALAITELAAQRVDDADRLATRAHRLCVQAKGADAVACANMMNTLGGVALERRDLDLAFRRYDAARASVERAIGSDNPGVFPILSNLASVAYARGEFERSAELRADLIARATRVLGPDHFNVGKVRVQYGITLERVGKLADAIAETAAGASVIEAARGPDFPSTVDAKIQLARLRVLAGQTDAVAAIRGLTALAPAAEIERLETEFEVARRELRGVDARAHAERALAIADDLRLTRHEPAARIALAYAVLLREAGDPGATAAAKRAVERNEAVFAAGSAPVLEVRALLARAESPAR